MLPGAQIVPCATAVDVFSAMLNDADVAVIPIENSLAGSVLDFYDLLHDVQHTEAKILREYMHRIRHNLIGRPGANLFEISQVLSHPIALAQCRMWFRRSPGIAPIATYDTAGSVKMMMEQDNLRIAAIASKQAAEIYGGQILQAGIEDNPENYTRFLLLQYAKNPGRPNVREIPIVGPPNKMSLIFTLKNQSGALVTALSIFSALQMNLTKIESRPIQGRPWEYTFYVDVHFAKPEAADSALEQLRSVCTDVIDLGRYKAAVLG